MALLVDPEYQHVLELGWRKNGKYWVRNRGKRTVLLHRYLYELAHKWCPKVVDHINQDTADNRLCNLRPATKRLNARNSSLTALSGKGYKGVRRHPRCKSRPYQALLQHRGKQHSLGYFATPEEAAERYREANEVIMEFEILRSEVC